MKVILGILVGIIIGVISNIIANFIAPHFEKRKKLAWSLFIGLIALSIVIVFLPDESTKHEIPLLPTASVRGEILYQEAGKWVLNSLSDGVNKIIPLPSNGITSFTWSPDGNSILFSYYENDTVYASLYLFSMDNYSYSKFLSLPNLHLLDPDWSPDGKSIVFVASPSKLLYGEDRKSEIYSIDIDKISLKQLTNTGKYNRDPAWSPDSSKIVYASEQDGKSVFRLFMMDRDGNNKTQLTYGGSVTDLHPVWSPDQSQIAFHSFRDNSQEIWILTLSTVETRKLTSGPPSSISTKPKWSADGKWIAFFSNRDLQRDPEHQLLGDIYITNLDTTALFKITTSGDTWYLLAGWRPKSP